MARFPLLLLGLAGFTHSLGAVEPGKAARATLWKIVREESAWTKVHAAEVLLAAGEREPIADTFRREQELHGQEKNYRVGIWRVMAQACPGERPLWWNKIAAAFLDPRAPDRLFALESLAKLGDPLTPELTAAVSSWAASAPLAERVFADWIEAQQGRPAGIKHLIEGLQSVEVLARYRSAYALRRLQCSDPEALAALRAAARTEPAESIARPVVIGAAYALAAESEQMANWRRALDQMISKGGPAAYDALQAWPTHGSDADLPFLVALLQHAEADVRTGAAGAILSIAVLLPATNSPKGANIR